MNKYCSNCGNELLPNSDICLKCGVTTTNQVVKEKKEKGIKIKEIKPIDNSNRNYFTGILGGIIGGFIASLPWILVEIYMEIIWSLLAALIAMGVAYGYKLLKGKVAKGYPLIIAVISFIVVLFNEFVTIPLWVFKQYNFPISFATLKLYYQNVELGKLIGPLFLVILFTVLGIINVIKKEKYLVNLTKENENSDTK